jgi:hypothetical protein
MLPRKVTEDKENNDLGLLVLKLFRRVSAFALTD